MRNPQELQVFRLADAAVMKVYRLTASFPAEERFGLTQQIRRAIVSAASNVVEGCSRESPADFRRFIEIATGSAMEARYQIDLARRLEYGSDTDLWSETAEAVDVATKSLIALKRTLLARQDRD